MNKKVSWLGTEKKNLAFVHSTVAMIVLMKDLWFAINTENTSVTPTRSGKIIEYLMESVLDALILPKDMPIARNADLKAQIEE